MKSISIQRANAVLLFGILTVFVLYIGRPFWVPLAFALLLCMLLEPVSRRIEGWGVSRFWATILCILLILLFIGGFCGVIYAQAVSFSKDWPQIQPKLQQMLTTVQQWVQQQFDMNPQEQVESAKKGLKQLSQSASGSFTKFLSGFGTLLTSFVLILLYFFFLMWKREKFREFLLRLFPADRKTETRHALGQIAKVSAQYLGGRLISMLFLGVVYAIGFTIFGLKNALLMSVIAVIPTLIPYVGAFIGAAFPLFMALVSGSSDALLPTVAVIVVAQVIDNNIIEPLVMGSRLNLSPIFTIIAIVVGELIWGIPGMILFEPLFAIIRIVCSHIPELHPYAFLLEDELEEPQWVQKVKKVFSGKS
ncbi:AI-2E family transporter [Tellurirhabdus rosea]|uniref:AI-2E family transporter n=1 Tax=Tellurirhabdus rosea TaxID=2674997 RepID=UPI0022533E55|nr:AI-2E family transporter [Tellurirhabdus rosea]